MTLLPILVCTVVGIAIIANNAQAQPRIYNDELRAIFDSPAATMREQRRPLQFESGKTVGNCADFLADGRRSDLAQTEENSRHRSDYTICDTLELLDRADWTPPPADGIPSYGKALLERLDLRSFRSSVRPRVTDQRYLPIQHWGKAATTSKYVLDFENEYWDYRLEVVAEGDVDHDGRADWIVWWYDTVKMGTYRYFGVLVISGPTETGLLRAKEIER